MGKIPSQCERRLGNISGSSEHICDVKSIGVMLRKSDENVY
jgi:hypothetical protein